MPSGGLLCPRWCITYKEGKSCGRHGCYGIVWYDEVQPTVSHDANLQSETVDAMLCYVTMPFSPVLFQFEDATVITLLAATARRALSPHMHAVVL